VPSPVLSHGRGRPTERLLALRAGEPTSQGIDIAGSGDSPSAPRRTASWCIPAPAWSDMAS
jgi:hypothetical protein